jgi:hypothetical protein
MGFEINIRASGIPYRSKKNSSTTFTELRPTNFTRASGVPYEFRKYFVTMGHEICLGSISTKFRVFINASAFNNEKTNIETCPLFHHHNCLHFPQIEKIQQRLWHSCLMIQNVIHLQRT